MLVLSDLGLGLTETAKRFVGVMSLMWAGSQVTKVRCTYCYLHLVVLLLCPYQSVPTCCRCLKVH